MRRLANHLLVLLGLWLVMVSVVSYLEAEHRVLVIAAGSVSLCCFTLAAYGYRRLDRATRYVFITGGHRVGEADGSEEHKDG